MMSMAFSAVWLRITLLHCSVGVFCFQAKALVLQQLARITVRESIGKAVCDALTHMCVDSGCSWCPDAHLVWHASVADNALCTCHGYHKRLTVCVVLDGNFVCHEPEHIFSLDHQSR
jgi:hypothetical protein